MTQPVEAPVAAPSALHLVAIGASAGGLEALEAFFQNVPPPPSGLAYVVVQHLSPEHKSMMESLLARHTNLPVVTAEDGMPLREDRVHLIPPGALLRLESGHLRLTPKSSKGLSLPIDVFFSSAATEMGPYVVGVVLSGTGSDGSRGAGAINEGGGLLLAQAPDEAKFDGMPRSVIGTGLVDAVLRVAAMPARIVAHVHSEPPPLLGAVGAKPTPMPWADGPEQALDGILRLLAQLGGLNFDDYKPATVMRRLERRMVVRQVSGLEAYLALLQADRTEVATLRRELLIPVTRFFRDEAAFEALRTEVIEPLVAAHKGDAPLRVWCAAASTGEEAYSIAMLFLQAFERLKRWPQLKVFATDVEQLNIEAASVGHYPDSVVAEVPHELLERYFERRNDGFAVKTALRQCVVFARHNLLSDPPFTRLDLVVCRNVLIYFKVPAQNRVLRRLQYALRPDGCLFLGPSESLGDCENDFAAVHSKAKVWRLVRPVSLLVERSLQPITAYSSASLRALRPAEPVKRVSHDLQALGQAALMKAYPPPPAVLVNGRLELVQSYGHVAPFVHPQPGDASLELQRWLPKDLLQAASTLLFKVGRDGSPARTSPLRLTLPGRESESGEASTLLLRLHARPAGESEGQRLTLLAFEPLDASTNGADGGNVMAMDSAHSDRLQALEAELAATRESLQATIEELETSNEELQATNEEMMSSNEELQSANEELQSVNEELNTVNAEYQEKIEILNRLNADLDSLARVVAAGTVFVDARLNVTRFSPEAAALFRFRSGDIGRPIDDLNHALVFPGFIEALRTALDTERIQEHDVASVNHRRYLVRMLPYRVASSGKSGVAISFLDITAVHEASRLQSILDALAEHVAVLDTQGVIQMVNQAWLDFANANGDSGAALSGPGTNYLRSCQVDGAQDAASAQAATSGLRAVLEGRAKAFSHEYPCHSPTEQRWFVMHVRPLLSSSAPGKVSGAVVSHVNITHWRERQGVQP